METKKHKHKWEKMQNDILATIFKKLNVIEMAPVSQVCRWWRVACSDPLIWNTLDLGLLKSNFILTKASPFVYVARKSDEMLMKLLRLAMAISRGNVTVLILNYNIFMKNDHLSYIAERTPRLKRLVMPCWDRIQTPIVCEAIRKWRHLESLTMPSIAEPNYIMQELSVNCENFTSLKIMDALTPHLALAIAYYLPHLKVLSLRCSILAEEALDTILDSMHELEVLNISHCMIVNDLDVHGKGCMVRELGDYVLEWRSRFRKFYWCRSEACIVCDRMVADEGLMKWHKYEKWLWRNDEVKSLALGRDSGKLFDKECFDLVWGN